MFITQKRIKNIIREEVVKILKEKSNPLPIYENKEEFLDAFHKAYPVSKNQNINNKLKKQLSMLVREVKGKIALQYLSDQRKESFVRFMQDMPKFKNAPKEEIINKFFSPKIKPKVLAIIEKIPVQMVNEGNQTPRMYRSFMPNFRQSGGQITAAYDEETNKIIINIYEYLNNNQLDIKMLSASLREEIYHAIDYNLSKTVIPMSKLQSQAARKRNIFISQEQSGLSKERYNYLTRPHEFYAKMLRLKDLVAEKFPNEIDQSGKIKNQFLKKIINVKNPAMLGDPNVFEIIQVLDPNKLQQIQGFFNLLAKRINKSPQRIA